MVVYCYVLISLYKRLWIRTSVLSMAHKRHGNGKMEVTQRQLDKMGLMKGMRSDSELPVEWQKHAEGFSGLVQSVRLIHD